MRKSIAVILIILILFTSISFPAANAVGNGTLTHLIPGTEAPEAEVVDPAYTSVLYKAEENQLVIASGITGNVRWKLDAEGTFSVNGEGDMGSCLNGKPWSAYESSICNVVLEEGVTSVGARAFSHSENLRSVQLPKSLRRIEESAFSQCSQLSRIAIPAAVEQIGESVFWGDDSLTAIEVDPANPAYFSSGRILYNRGQTKLLCCSGADNGYIIVPDGITEIGRSAFFRNNDLTTVELPRTLERVDDYAFSGCDNLSTIIWHGTLAEWEGLSVSGSNEALEKAELVFTELADRPSKSVMETLLDDGELQILAKDRFMEIEFSGIEIADSYVLDEDNIEEGIEEYSWRVSFSDGQHNYHVATVYPAQTPGLNRVGSIDEMENLLMVEEGKGRIYPIGNVNMTHTDNSIHWSVEFPSPYKVDFSAIRLFQTRVFQFVKLSSQESRHYISVDPAAIHFDDIGKAVLLGHYEQDDVASNGPESLSWIILEVEKERALLLCERGIDCIPWHKAWESNLTWEACSLREWLNNNFLNMAFSEEEREKIMSTTLFNSNASGVTQPTTEDRVFLLSLQETDQYLNTEELRECEQTSYAIGRGAGNILDTEDWWLRNPQCNYDITTIGFYGEVNENGRSATASDICVRPAIWISLE